MTKSPQLGRVKTRMQPQLTQEQSLVLHQYLTACCFSQWQENAICPLDVWVGGDVALFSNVMSDILSPSIFNNGKAIYEQVAGDLGARMAYAVKQSLEQQTLKGVILLGTDCPFIDKDYLLSAVTALEQGRDVVIGPALDGGYVLLGLKGDHPELFEDISWGAHKVFEETCRRIELLDLSFDCLPPLSDIDTAADLPLLATLIESNTPYSDIIESLLNES